MSGFDLCWRMRSPNLLRGAISILADAARPVASPMAPSSPLWRCWRAGRTPSARFGAGRRPRPGRARLPNPPRSSRASPSGSACACASRTHWHVYWRNPGDSGRGAAIAWQLPPGFSAGPIAWPTPQRIPVAHLVNFGYEDETTLLHAHHAACRDSSGGAPVAIKADVTWLVCEKECIPGEASLSLSRARRRPRAPPQHRIADRGHLRCGARGACRSPRPGARACELAPDRLTLKVDAKGLRPETVRSAYFFPNAETLVRHAAPQQLQRRARRPDTARSSAALSSGQRHRRRRRARHRGGARRQRRRGRLRARRRAHPAAAARRHEPHRSPPCCRRRCSPSSAASSST